MKKVLLVNHYQKACGVQQFALRIWNLIKDSQNVEYFYREVEDPNMFHIYVDQIKPDVIIYNWHQGTMPWLTEEMVAALNGIKHYFIFHDGISRKVYDKYLFFGAYDFSEGRLCGDRGVLLPRPLLKYAGGYPKNDVLTIGSFGFGFWNKGYHTLSKLINDNYDVAVINYLMPYSYFGDRRKVQTSAVIAECRRLVSKPEITLNIYNEFLSEDGVLKFLAENDINIFLYGENGEGISSVIDYALSVRRPIAISDSRMFRHIASNEIILDDNNSIENIIHMVGTKPLEKFYSSWNPHKFMYEMDKVINGD